MFLTSSGISTIFSLQAGNMDATEKNRTTCVQTCAATSSILELALNTDTQRSKAYKGFIT